MARPASGTAHIDEAKELLRTAKTADELRQAQAVLLPLTLGFSLFLPPYSLELNPVEHLWDELREKYFHNRVFSSLTEVEQHLFESLVAFERNTECIRSICAWPWIINSVYNANYNKTKPCP